MRRVALTLALSLPLCAAAQSAVEVDNGSGGKEFIIQDDKPSADKPAGDKPAADKAASKPEEIEVEVGGEAAEMDAAGGDASGGSGVQVESKKHGKTKSSGARSSHPKKKRHR